MNGYRISLTLEGVDPPHRRVRATDFLRELQLLLNSLRGVEGQIKRPADRALYYHIVELSYGSPATVVVEPIPADPTVDIRAEVVSSFTSLLGRIARGEPLRDKVSHSLIEGLAEMALPVGRSLSLVRVSTPAEAFELTSAFWIHAKEMLRPEETYPGFMRGMLEAINLHRSANVFRIYPDVGPTKVTCRFPAELQSAAIQSVGRFVEVHGILKYKASAQYPHELQVTSLEALPDENELPSLTGLRGVAPNATGTQASEAFVRALRNAAD